MQVSGSAAGSIENTPNIHEGMASDARLAVFDIGNAATGLWSVPISMETEMFPAAYDIGEDDFICEDHDVLDQPRVSSHSWATPFGGYGMAAR